MDNYAYLVFVVLSERILEFFVPLKVTSVVHSYGSQCEPFLVPLDRSCYRVAIPRPFRSRALVSFCWHW